MKTILLILFLSCSVVSFSQELSCTDGSIVYNDNALEKAYNKESEDLNNSKEYGTSTWIELEVKYLALWDRELNHFYQDLLKKLDPEKRKMLVESQRAWLEYYQKESKFLSELLIVDFMNGSCGQALYSRKLLSEKKKRTYELVEYWHIFGGEIEWLFDKMKK